MTAQNHGEVEDIGTSGLYAGSRIAKTGVWDRENE